MKKILRRFALSCVFTYLEMTKMKKVLKIIQKGNYLKINLIWVSVGAGRDLPSLKHNLFMAVLEPAPTNLKTNTAPDITNFM